MKRRGLLSLAALLILCLLAGICAAEETEGVVAKVTTKKGPLKMRSAADAGSRVLAEIPNGTCLLVLSEEPQWCGIEWNGKKGYCSAAYLTLLQEADRSLLSYRVLRKGDKGEDVRSLKERLQELGFLRPGSALTDSYNAVMAERVSLLQRQLNITEDGVASQELQAFVFSDKAPVCTQELPRQRAHVSISSENRVICGCCFGEGCPCCDFKGWIAF